MIVKKSDGYTEDFDEKKVKNGIYGAYASINEAPSESIVDNIITNLY